MQEKAGEQGAAYIPMPKDKGFTPHFDNRPSLVFSDGLCFVRFCTMHEPESNRPVQRLEPLCT